VRAAVAALLVLPMLLAAAPPSPSPSAPAAEDRRYEDYVSTVTRNLGGLLGAAISLQGCRAERGACVRRLGDVKATVDDFRRDLNAHPAPACLHDADAKLRSGLDLYDRGLTSMQQAGETQDRGKLALGVVIVAAGTARLAVAIRQGRQANC
jgi:hypothetical protein